MKTKIWRTPPRVHIDGGEVAKTVDEDDIVVVILNGVSSE